MKVIKHRALYLPLGVFQRLHRKEDSEGTGVDLTVQHIIHRDGGQIRAEAELGEGVAFCFTLDAQGGIPETETTGGEHCMSGNEIENAFCDNFWLSVVKLPPQVRL
jgi:hypothetical protein